MDENENEDKFQEIFASLPTYTQFTFGSHVYDTEAEKGPNGQHPIKEAAAVFSFCEQGFGFGELTLVVDSKGQHYLDAEGMSLERVRRFLNRVLDNAILDTDMDPERHRKYNQAMRRTCGAGCPACHPNVEGRSSPSE